MGTYYINKDITVKCTFLALYENLHIDDLALGPSTGPSTGSRAALWGEGGGSYGEGDRVYG